MDLFFTMQGSFSEESLEVFNKLASATQDLDYSESRTDPYDFTRCVRPNGTAYGTGGKCKSGVEQTKEEITKSVVNAVSNYVKKKRGSKGVSGEEEYKLQEHVKDFLGEMKGGVQGVPTGQLVEGFFRDQARRGSQQVFQSENPRFILSDGKGTGSWEKVTPPAKRTKAERDMAAKATLQRMAAKGPETSVRKQGDRVVVSKGSEFKAVLHPEHQTALGKLKEGEKHEFEDEQGTWWKATRSGDNLNLEGGDRRSGNKPYKLNVKRSEIASVDPRKSLMSQARHPDTFRKKANLEALREMSDADLEIRKKYLKNASGYIGYKRDVDSVGQEIQRRVDEKVHETRPILTDVGTKKNSLKVKSSVSSQGGSYSVPGYSSSDTDISHKGQHYTYTGKSGTIIKTGEPSKEFQTEGERRVYVSNSGELYED
jgi:hypothetical protein